jgi:hypothetical protein
MRTALRNNGLGLFFMVIFLLALIGQALVGHADYNNQQVSQGLDAVSLWRFVTSSTFATDVTENWQSEYLQFLLYAFATVWFVQQGSPESKQLSDVGTESDEQQKLGAYVQPESPRWARAGGWRTVVYSRSLCSVVGLTFLGSWFAQSVSGWSAYNEEQLGELEAPLTWAQYVSSADFWNRTLQNWQSEFLAVGSFAVLAVYLRQRGSAESKPVGSPHQATGVEG